MTIKITVDNRSKDAPFIAYAPELDVASCGPTEEKARKNLHESVKILMQEVERKVSYDRLLSRSIEKFRSLSS